MLVPIFLAILQIDLNSYDFEINITHLDDRLQSCGPNQNNQYRLDVASDYSGEPIIGVNYPYYIQVTMEHAASPTEAAFQELIEITTRTDLPTIIEGVPAGIVRFHAYNNCAGEYGFATDFHDNCCEDFACALVRKRDNPSAGNGEIYEFPGLEIHTEYTCYDREQSQIRVVPKGGTHMRDHERSYPCWTGTIEVIYFEGSETTYNYVFEVYRNPQNPREMLSRRISGDDNAHVSGLSGPGEYTLQIVTSQG